MKGVFLDIESIAASDLDLSFFRQSLDEWNCHPRTPALLCAERIRDADVVAVNKTVVDRQAMQGARALKLIVVAATGTNNIDLDAARELGIAVTNVSGYSSATVAQHTLTLLLMLATNINRYLTDVACGGWGKSKVFCLLDHPIQELAGKTMGIIGYGQIGRAVARAAIGMGMKVVAAQSLNPTIGHSEHDTNRLPLDQLLSSADVVSLHCPLTGETAHIIDAQALALMKPSALLLNVSRGGLVDESALLDALLHRRIAGAGLDVLETEPPTGNHPLIDAKLPNLLITPHCAWGSTEARQRLINEMGKNIRAFRAGEKRNRLV